MLAPTNYHSISKRLLSPRRRTREAAALEIWRTERTRKQLLGLIPEDVADEKRREFKAWWTA